MNKKVIDDLHKSALNHGTLLEAGINAFLYNLSHLYNPRVVYYGAKQYWFVRIATYPGQQHLTYFLSLEEKDDVKPSPNDLSFHVWQRHYATNPYTRKISAITKRQDLLHFGLNQDGIVTALTYYKPDTGKQIAPHLGHQHLDTQEMREIGRILDKARQVFTPK